MLAFDRRLSNFRRRGDESNGAELGSPMGRLKLATALFYAALSFSWCSAVTAQAIVVGAKEFTEQLLVAEMTSQLLRAAGFNTHSGSGFTTGSIRKLQESGLVDVYWEYTGTSLVTFNGVAEKLSAAEGYARVKELDARRGLIWLAPSKVNNSYALAMRRADAAARGIGSISDLAARVRRGERVTLAAPVEFLERPDGLKPLERAYGFEFGLANAVGTNVRDLREVLGRLSEFDVGVVFATDAQTSALDLIILRDDLGFFPGYLLTPVIRQTTLEREPRIKAILEGLSAQLDNESMAALNAAVDLNRRSVQDAAAGFLQGRGLLKQP